MRAAHVGQIWRYPVKSMAGERLERAELREGGIPGDRGWAVRDEVRGAIGSGRRLPGLLGCSARYPLGLEPDDKTAAEISLPDGSTLRSDAPDASARLSGALGQPVTLWPRVPAEQLEHYRRGPPVHSDMAQELRSVFGLEPDEPLPDLSRFPPELLRYETPPGTYFDAYPLLLLSDASLAHLQAAAPDSRIDVRRFRPNLLLEVEGGASGLVETGWCGRRLRVGGAVLEVHMEAPRCVMTTHGFDDLPEDPRIMRSLVRHARQNLGVYATIVEPGAVALGDGVELEA